MKNKNSQYIIKKIFYFIIFFVYALIIYILLKKIFRINENMSNNVIPLDIYQTWKIKDLPPKMKECVERLKRMNPKFKHYLYDNNDCMEFIKNNFDKDVLEAYNNLVPGAYKADLWRYCILYKKGGIYLDIKYSNLDKFDLIEMIDKEYYVKDLPQSGNGVYNAFLICKAGNQKLLKCINKIVENVKNKYYGTGSLEITGPLLMKNFFTENEINNFELTIGEHNNITTIFWKNRPILSFYPEYREEKKKIGPDYHNDYVNKKVYRN
jgi:mannosyltransferase OCH1-like enzyme